MTIGQLLKIYNIPESELLLAELLKKPKEFLHLHPETKLTLHQKNKFLKLYRAFIKGVPVAYLLGYKYFYGLKFSVNKNVLIPRPESEWLIDRALEYFNSLPRQTKKLHVLDMGTGSGVLITTLAVNTRSSIPRSSSTTRASGSYKYEFLGVDVSKTALAVASKNILAHKAKVKLKQSNLFESISGKFDLILANLPYVPISDYKKLLPNLKSEPKLALTDGTDNSLLINKFLTQAHLHMNEYTLVLMEIDPSSKKMITELNKKMSLYNLNFYKDIKGLWRYCAVTLTKK